MVRRDGRPLVASKRNDNGILVFIPEKYIVDKKVFTIPFRFQHIMPDTMTTIYSERESAGMTIRFRVNDINIGVPFTIPTLVKAFQFAVSQKNTSRPKVGQYNAETGQLVTPTKAVDLKDYYKQIL